MDHLDHSGNDRAHKSKITLILESVTLKRWLILGGGIQGMAAAELLARRGASVTVSDTRPLNSQQGEIADRLGIPILIGGDQATHLRGMTHLVLSPGISPKSPLVNAAIHQGMVITNEIDIALDDYAGDLIAVTGTNGKSTTCSMIAHLLQRQGIDCALVGNIGLPPSAIIAATGQLPTTLVIELSSYQLETATSLTPRVVCFTSFSFDHIERHGSEREYFAVKWRLITKADEGALAIMPQYILAAAKRYGQPSPKCKLIVIAENQESIEGATEVIHSVGGGLYQSSLGRKIQISSTVLGNHNKLNSLISIISVDYLSKNTKSLSELSAELDNFVALPHRCQNIGKINGFLVMDDSKSTNLESTAAALSQFDHPVILMLGGRGKGESFAPLKNLHQKIRKVLVFGESGSKIYSELKDLFPTDRFNKLEDALNFVLQNSAFIDAPLLFSPGCASQDEFHNFEHRGKHFSMRLRPLLD